MGVICYTTQRDFGPGVDYRNPRWFESPLWRDGDRVVVVGRWPSVVAAYRAEGVPVEVQDQPYMGGEPEPESATVDAPESEPVLAAPVVHRHVEAVTPQPLFSMTRAELQAVAKERGAVVKAAASRTDLLRALGAL